MTTLGRAYMFDQTSFLQFIQLFLDTIGGNPDNCSKLNACSCGVETDLFQNLFLGTFFGFLGTRPSFLGTISSSWVLFVCHQIIFCCKDTAFF